MTTNYDDVLERAFAEADEPVDVVVYEMRRKRAAVRALRPDGERVPIRGATYREFALEERRVILKIHGDVDRDDVERDSSSSPRTTTSTTSPAKASAS